METDHPYFLLAGYAGTGKTTMAQSIAESVGPETLFGAFTGKAALRLQEKGCVGAGTIHSLIYLPRTKCAERLRQLKRDLELAGSDNERARLLVLVQRETVNLTRPEFTLNEDSELRGAPLLVVDEASMIGSRMGEDILSFGAKVVFLGDPAQLGPVSDTCFFKGLEPDYLLTDVHRQAEGSGILSLATAVREGRGLVIDEDATDAAVVPKGTLSISAVCEYDQVIVGYNKSRKVLNAQMRQHLGYETGLPEAGDRLICLNNDSDRGLLNGGQWHVRASDIIDDDMMLVNIVPDYDLDRDPVEMMAHRHYFEDREDQLAPWNRREAGCFDFAYAITCHKAQGSEYDRVLVIYEPVPRNQAWRWAYTAITRASKEVTVVR